MTKQKHYIISCEHASNEVPDHYAALFDGAGEVLESHRGWDPGALEVAERIAERLDVELQIYPWTRLLIEPNRSEGHRSLFSEYTKALGKDRKSIMIKELWSPYRDRIRRKIRAATASGKQVIHISVHTFTPVWDGQERNLDIGLLYDPLRKTEQRFCREWKIGLANKLPEFRVRMNRPYLGTADGHSTSIRKEFSEECYLGIEIEVSQKYWIDTQFEWTSICENIAGSLVLISDEGY